MPRVNIIGIGSAHGGDRAGWQLIEALQRTGFEHRFAPGSVTLSVCRFPAQLIQLLDGFDRAIVLDAVEQAGNGIFEYSREDLLFSRHLHSTHGIGVGEALALADRLLTPPVDVSVLGIGVGEREEAAEFDVSHLLPVLEKRLTTVLQAGEDASGCVKA